MVQDLVNVVVYSVIGIIFMMAGIFMVDVVIPCNFPEEIKKGNTAVGYIIAGISIAIGTVLKSAIMSPAAEAAEHSLLEGIMGTAVYFVVGVLFCIIGYYAMLLFNKKYDLNKEIGNQNGAAGIMVMGLFIGIGIVISGVIY